MATGIFGLGEIYSKQVKDSTENTYSNWPEGGSYGYITGKGPPASGSPEVDRISLETDTSSQISSTSIGGFGLTEFDTAEYGYFIGGSAPPARSTVNRIDFSAETFSTPGYFTNSHYDGASIQNYNYGYTIAGINVGSYDSLIRRFDFSNETSSNLSNSLPITFTQNAGVQSETDGYSVGGVDPVGKISSIYKFNFSTESYILSSTNTPTAINAVSSIENSNYGYFAGGTTPSSSNVCDVFRLDFSNDAISSPGTNMSNVFTTAATTKGMNYGYWITGYSSTSPLGDGTTCRIFKLNFSTETAEFLGDSSFNSNRRNASAVTNKGPFYPIKGYKAYGYIVGGENSVPAYKSSMIRIDFSTDGTSSNPGNILSYNIAKSMSTSSTTHGYVAGGDDPVGTVSTISKIDFTSETISNSSTNLMAERRETGSVSTSEYGYYIGGGNPVSYTRVERHDFATDSRSTSFPHNGGESYNWTRFPTSLNMTGVTGASNDQYGYFIESDDIYRFDFSNDSAYKYDISVSPIYLKKPGRVQNNNYAYLTNVVPPGTTYTSRILKFDFSNNSVSEGNTFPNPIGLSAGVSANYVGYFCGGIQNGSLSSNIIQLDFSTESASDTGNNLSSGNIKSCVGLENASGSGS